MTNASFPAALSKHRIEALTDGIFAVAMTLLVMELKLPEHLVIASDGELIDAVLGLLPKFFAWLVSFTVLAMFWLGHHRLFHFVRQVDIKLLWITMLTLGGASLLPFSSAINGEHTSFFSQLVYSANMVVLGFSALWASRYVHKHPALCVTPLTEAMYRAARLRTGGLILIAAIAAVISYRVRGMGNIAFMLMFPIGLLSRRIEQPSAGALNAPAAAPLQ